MAARRNHYEVLGLDTSAGHDEIRARYLELVRLYHPDLHPDKAYAARLFAQVNKAYGELHRPARRERYDKRLGLGAPAAPAPQSLADQARLVATASDEFLRGKIADARASCEEALRAGPACGAALVLLGDIDAAQGRFADAAARYRAAVAAGDASVLLREKVRRVEAFAASPAPRSARPRP